MDVEPRPFEVIIAKKSHFLELGKCAVTLFRQKQEVDYLLINTTEEGEEPTNISVMNNQEFVRWLTGCAFDAQGAVYNTTWDVEGEEKSFRGMYGWNPAVVIKERPEEWEEEMWIDINTRDLNSGLTKLIGDEDG